jgi:hypothetical protein
MVTALKANGRGDKTGTGREGAKGELLGVHIGLKLAFYMALGPIPKIPSGSCCITH